MAVWRRLKPDAAKVARPVLRGLGGLRGSPGYPAGAKNLNSWLEITEIRISGAILMEPEKIGHIVQIRPLGA